MIAIRRGRAIVSALLVAGTLLFAPTAHADRSSLIQNYAWQGGNFACYAVQVVGPYWGAAPYANWNLWRINDGAFTREELYLILALGAAQKCPEYLWIFTAMLPPDVARTIVAPPPADLPQQDS